ncbi:unnamed protein product [Effrenium voratum]|uniref:DNA polymerase epsilon catalytic subunit n=1 Tax=Effrenium voratum TaxID=2562239 RepID=A0AA36JNJ0_9DINO|nr:unnamed protein product [Effrenium voratum]
MSVWGGEQGRIAGHKMLVEPMIQGEYMKFNSNTGHAEPDSATMQALSHFSYHASNGRYLLCDLQGGRYNGYYILTDPVIHSKSKEFGGTDLGAEGIENFMAHHVCGRFCSPNWKMPPAQKLIPHFQAVCGTTFGEAEQLFSAQSRKQLEIQVKKELRISIRKVWENALPVNQIVIHKSKKGTNRLVECSTYEGARVECMRVGVYRADIKETFQIEPSAVQTLLEDLKATVDFFLLEEEKVKLEDVENYQEILAEVEAQLRALCDPDKARSRGAAEPRGSERRIDGATNDMILLNDASTEQPSLFQRFLCYCQPQVRVKNTMDKVPQLKGLAGLLVQDGDHITGGSLFTLKYAKWDPEKRTAIVPVDGGACWWFSGTAGLWTATAYSPLFCVLANGARCSNFTYNFSFSEDFLFGNIDISVNPCLCLPWLPPWLTVPRCIQSFTMKQDNGSMDGTDWSRYNSTLGCPAQFYYKLREVWDVDGNPGKFFERLEIVPQGFRAEVASQVGRITQETSPLKTQKAPGEEEKEDGYQLKMVEYEVIEGKGGIKSGGKKVKKSSYRVIKDDFPLIYHLDVGAMYPNIILSNRLQPMAIVDKEFCNSCSYNDPANNCQREMEWKHRADLYMATRADVKAIINEMESEKRLYNHKDRDSGEVSRVKWSELAERERTEEIIKAVRQFSQKAYKRLKSSVYEDKKDIVCQRENPFYVNTVLNFRDRRYMFKKQARISGQIVWPPLAILSDGCRVAQTKEWNKKLEKAEESGRLRTLGLPEGASRAEIKSAYRRLALKFHPDLDKSRQATSRFMEIRNAYKQLMASPSRQRRSPRSQRSRAEHSPEPRARRSKASGAGAK